MRDKKTNCAINAIKEINRFTAILFVSSLS